MSVRRSLQRIAPTVTMATAIALFILAPVVAIGSYDLLLRFAEMQGVGEHPAAVILAALGGLWEAFVLATLAKDLTK